MVMNGFCKNLTEKLNEYLKVNHLMVYIDDQDHLLINEGDVIIEITPYNNVASEYDNSRLYILCNPITRNYTMTSLSKKYQKHYSDILEILINCMDKENLKSIFV